MESRLQVLDLAAPPPYPEGISYGVTGEAKLVQSLQSPTATSQKHLQPGWEALPAAEKEWTHVESRRPWAQREAEVQARIDAQSASEAAGAGTGAESGDGHCSEPKSSRRTAQQRRRKAAKANADVDVSEDEDGYYDAEESQSPVPQIQVQVQLQGWIGAAQNFISEQFFALSERIFAI